MREHFPHEAEFFAACKARDIDEEDGAELFKQWNGLNNVGYRVPFKTFIDQRTSKKRSRFKVVADKNFGVRRLVPRR